MTRLDLVPRAHLDPELRDTLEAFERACPDFNPRVFQALGQHPELSKAFYLSTSQLGCMASSISSSLTGLFIGYGRLIAILDLEDPVTPMEAKGTGEVSAEIPDPCSPEL